MDPPGIKKLLSAMIGWQASDLFLCEGKIPALRIHGTLRKAEVPPISPAELAAFLDEVVPPDGLETLRRTGDLDIGYTLKEGLRFRLNLARQQGRLSLVARAVPSGELSLEALGLPPVLRTLSDLPRGLVLFTGATGSGKSTTLAALIHHMNQGRSVHIVTIEDPIEFLHRDIRARISQREVGADTTSFAVALRHVVRQSPDVIVIGEMRDLETMQVAISAALTGHLVLATLHTIDVTQSIQRILSYFPEHLRQQAALDLSLALKGVVSQRLVPRKSGKGRALAAEVLLMSPAASRLIQELRVDELSDYMKSADDPQVVTFNEALLRLYQSGDITLDIGRAFATQPEEFALMAGGMTTGVAAFGRGDGTGGAPGMDMKALLQACRDQGASDLHLTVGRPPMLRVAGSLVPLDQTPSLSAQDMRLLLHSIMSSRQWQTYELEREIDFALALEGGERFRVNAYHQKGQMAASLRTINTRIPDARELGLPEVVLRAGERAQGLLLVVGPTGSGKTTTLACLLDRINQGRACRIITVEDPIEYVHFGKKATVDQREVHADTQSFAAALKYVLRQDPDVILVGEMRDLETTAAAITAAETGHLVLGTLHTNDAVGVIDRMVDMFPGHQQPQVRSQLAASLLVVVSQRLLPRATGEGRAAAFEVLVATPAVRTLIRENKMHQALSLIETGRATGMITMDNSLESLVKRGVVRKEDALAHIRNPKLLE